MTRQKTHREVILDYLTFITPRKATRQEIRLQTGLPGDQVLNGLLDLQRAGRVQSIVDPPDSPRVFWVENAAVPAIGAAPRSGWPKAHGVASDFETLALTSLCHYFCCHLARRSFPGHEHPLIGSEDGTMLGEIVYITDAGSLPALEACRQELAALNVPAPILITGGDFDLLWAWFEDHATAAPAVQLFFITQKGEIISLDADMVGKE